MIEPLTKKTEIGEKTETRRLLKINPESKFSHIDTPGFLYKGDNKNGDPIEIEKPLVAWFDGEFYFEKFGWLDHAGFTPRYNIGEVVYIKEPYCFDAMGRLKYKYLMPPEDRKFFKWKNKLFMPAKHARLHIKILDIKVERFTDISLESLKKEGMFDLPLGLPKKKQYVALSKELPKLLYCLDHYCFFQLIKNLNPKTPLNSWCWVYCYERIQLPK
ncbi:MAG: hypothetical protein AAGF96_18905 [Bacteroidota bacterium]